MKLSQGNSSISKIKITSSNKEKSYGFDLSGNAEISLDAGVHLVMTDDKSIMTQIKVCDDSDDKTLFDLFSA